MQIGESTFVIIGHEVMSSTNDIIDSGGSAVLMEFLVENSRLLSDGVCLKLLFVHEPAGIRQHLRIRGDVKLHA